MQDICHLPFACATARSAVAEWCGYTLAVMSHPDLNHEQKYLWMWLANRSASKSHHSCSFSYEQISQATGLSTKTIHRALFKLKLTGLLNGNIPIWYGVPTMEMNKEIRTLRPLFISQNNLSIQQYIKQYSQAKRSSK